jgi:hypothetical protein
VHSFVHQLSVPSLNERLLLYIRCYHTYLCMYQIITRGLSHVNLTHFQSRNFTLNQLYMYLPKQWNFFNRSRFVGFFTFNLTLVNLEHIHFERARVNSFDNVGMYLLCNLCRKVCARFLTPALLQKEKVPNKPKLFKGGGGSITGTATLHFGGLARRGLPGA